MTNVTNLSADNRMAMEAAECCDLAFVKSAGGKVVSWWAPAKIEAGCDFKRRVNESVLGVAYARDLINHMREFADFDVSDCLGDIVEAAIKRGEWGGVEIGFFAELGRHLSEGAALPADCDQANAA